MAKVRIEDEVVIDAPGEEVWAAIKDPAAHAAWHPFVTRIEGEHRVGATRKCFVAMGEKTGETSERCIADEGGRRIAWAIESDTTGFLRMVSDWTAGFGLESRDGRTLVRAESVFQPKGALVRLMLPMIRRKFHRTQQAILAGLKRSVEA